MLRWLKFGVVLYFQITLFPSCFEKFLFLVICNYPFMLLYTIYSFEAISHLI